MRFSTAAVSAIIMAMTASAAISKRGMAERRAPAPLLEGILPSGLIPGTDDLLGSGDKKSSASESSVDAPTKPSVPTNAGDLTIAEAQNICGQDLEVKCCNNIDASTNVNDNGGEGVLSGVLGGLLGNGGLTLTDGCSNIDVLIANGILNSQCKQSVSCCKTDGNTASGVVAAQLPCIPLAGLI